MGDDAWVSRLVEAQNWRLANAAKHHIYRTECGRRRPFGSLGTKEPAPSRKHSWGRVGGVKKKKNISQGRPRFSKKTRRRVPAHGREKKILKQGRKRG